MDEGRIAGETDSSPSIGVFVLIPTSKPRTIDQHMTDAHISNPSSSYIAKTNKLNLWLKGYAPGLLWWAHCEHIGSAILAVSSSVCEAFFIFVNS
jgi:hypothetical protein